MSANKIIQAFARKTLTKNQGSGITTIPNQFVADSKAGEILTLLKNAGLPINQLDDYIRSEADLVKFINLIQSANKPRIIPGTSSEGKAITEKLFGKKGEVVEFPQKRSFKEEIDAMKKSGDIVDPNNLKKNDNVLTREMFQDSNLNKVARDRDRAIKAKARIEEKNKEPISEKFIDYTIQDINKKEPLEGMKIANKIIKREGEFKDLTEEQSKRILKETDDHLTGKDMDYDPEDFYAKGGRAGFALGSMVNQASQASEGIESRLEQLGGDVTSAEKLLQQINERLESAGSSVPEGGGGGLGELLGEGGGNPYAPPNRLNDMMANDPRFQNLTTGNPFFKDPVTGGGQPFPGPTLGKPFLEGGPERPLVQAPPTVTGGTLYKDFNQLPGGPQQGRVPGNPELAGPVSSIGQLTVMPSVPGDNNGFNFRQEGDYGRYIADNDPGMQFAGYSNYQDYIGAGNDPVERRGMGLQQLQSASSKENMMKALPGLFAKGGRAGFYTGGITDVEPSLDDIGHGADAMNSRTRLMSPGSQATTSTGLNYLLAEDNDNMRIPFGDGNTVQDKIKTMQKDFDNYKKGGGKISYKKFAAAYIPENFAEGGRIGFSAGGGGRRAFLKFLASIGGLTAAAKSGMIGLGEGTTKKAITETVKQSAGSTYPPPYFYKLVEKIKFMGDDTLASQDKAVAKKYKDYIMEEDFAGNIEIIKKGDNVSEDVFMSLKVDDVPMKGKNKPTKVKEYEEYTATPDAEGKMKNIEQGVPDEVIDEAGDTTAMTLKKADGGRIGFSGGGIFRAIIAKSAAKAGMKPYEYIKATSYKSLPPEVKMFMSAEDFAKLKSGQQDMYTNYIDMAKTRKNFQKQVEGGKTTPARELFEGMEKTMDEQSFVPKTVTDKDIAEMELMVKNRFNKGRKDNAEGGLQTMLGE